MSELVVDLPAVLAALVKGTDCRAYTGVQDGSVLQECSGAASVVTIACEHEHFFDARICERHRASLGARLRPCPFCVAAERQAHRCRVAAVGGGA